MGSLPSKKKGSKKHPELEQPKTAPTKPILEVLSEDGSIDMEFLKQISRRCLERLKARRAEEKCQSF